MDARPQEVRDTESRPVLSSAGALADASCIAAILKGERQRFSELVERYQRMVYVVVRGYVGDAHAAEDAAQEVFVNAFTHLHALREPAQFQPWLLQIARHHAARSNRREGRRLDREPIMPEVAAPEPAAAKALPPLDSVLGRLQELPEPYRSTLTRKYVLERSCKEIAAEEGVSIGTVTSRLTRGLELLRLALK